MELSVQKKQFRGIVLTELQIPKIMNTSRITSSAMQSRAQTFTFWNIRLTRT